MAEFFAMGGYAPYIWTSYGLALLVLVGLLLSSWKSLRDNERLLTTLEAARPARRRRNRDGGAYVPAAFQDGAARNRAEDRGDGGGGEGDALK